MIVYMNGVDIHALVHYTNEGPYFESVLVFQQSCFIFVAATVAIVGLENCNPTPVTSCTVSAAAAIQ